MLVGLGFATAVLPLALTQHANPVVRPQAHFALLRLYRVSPVGVACCLASGLINGAYYSMVPVFLERAGYGAGSVAAYISAAMLAGLLVQYPVGMLSDRIGRRPVTMGAILAAIVLALALGFAAGVPFAAIAALGFCFAGMTAPLYGLGAGQTNDRMERGDYVAASGGLLFVWSLGSSVSPSAAGVLMGRVGPEGLFWYIACGTGRARPVHRHKDAATRRGAAREADAVRARPLRPAAARGTGAPPRAPAVHAAAPPDPRSDRLIRCAIPRFRCSARD